MKEKNISKSDAREVEITESGEDEVMDAEEQSTKKMSKKELVKEIELLQTEMKALAEEKTEQNEKVLRIHAETENFKKRLEREKGDFVRYSNEKVIKEFLPVVDNLERAVAHAKESGETGGFLEGVEMTLNMFHQARIAHQTEHGSIESTGTQVARLLEVLEMPDQHRRALEAEFRLVGS